MTNYDPRDQDSDVISGPAPTQEPDDALVPVSLVATLTKAEIDQQIATAHAYPRSPAAARDRMIGLATLDDQMASECIYSVPRGGKQIRGPSIRFAEIVLSAGATSGARPASVTRTASSAMSRPKPSCMIWRRTSATWPARAAPSN